MTILETKNLCKNYSSFTLDDINLKINKGEITALVGENGAGKSTTIGCISSIIQKSSGTITFQGKDISLLSSKERERLAFAYDDTSFPLDFTINDIEKYKKMSLYVTRENAVKLKKDEYFIADLIGLKVINEDET